VAQCVDGNEFFARIDDFECKVKSFLNAIAVEAKPITQVLR